MPRRGKQKTPNRPVGKKAAKSRRTPREIPNKSSILSTETFVSPKGAQYTILKTDQMDPYDEPKLGRRKGRAR
jgi:hypothetical protein